MQRGNSTRSSGGFPHTTELDSWLARATSFPRIKSSFQNIVARDGLLFIDWQYSMQRLFAVIVVVVSIAATSGCGGESYDLRGEVATGDVYRSTSSFTVHNGQVTVETSGERVQGSAEVRIEETTETDILNAEDGQTTRLKVSWMSGAGNMTMKVPGQSAEETPTPLPLLGRSVLFWQDGGGLQSRLVGSEPTEEQAVAIQEHGHPWPEDFVPTKKVAVGSSWTHGGEHLRQWLGFSDEGFAGTMKVHFDKVVDYNNERCALLSVQIDASGTSPMPEGPPLSVSMSGEGFVYRSLSKKIDVYSKISGDLQWKMSGVEDGLEIRLTINGPFFVEVQDTKD